MSNFPEKPGLFHRARHGFRREEDREVCEQIVAIICRIGKLSKLDPQEDFYTAGLSSLRALELLLELESAFSVTIPDDRFITLRTAHGLQDMIADLKKEQQTP